MVVTLMTNSNYSNITLPEKVSGQYWLKFSDEHESSGGSISIEGVLGQWELKLDKTVSLLDDTNTAASSVILQPMSVYHLHFNQTGESAYVYTEPITNDRQTFHKYVVGQEEVEFLIGRNPDNDIVFANKFVSASHAKIIYRDNNFFVTDMRSANGTFVNGERIQSQALVPGDMIYIMGLKIVVGHMFLSLNNPDKLVEIKNDVLLKYIRQEPEAVPDDDENQREAPKRFFFRSPRFKRDVKAVEIKVDPPPERQDKDEMPLALVIAPSITMGMASMTMGIFVVNNALAMGNINRAIPAVAMCLSMLCGAVLWPILSKRYDRARKAKKEAKRQKKYREYLNSVVAEFNDACAKEEEILCENYIKIGECLNMIQSGHRDLWSRSVEHSDFLKLRIGIGESLLTDNISYEKRKFLIDEDNLREEMIAVCESPRKLKEIPIVLSLNNDFISGVIGEDKQAREFAIGLIFQIATFYSYDEVKMVFLLDEKDMEKFSFAKWLPHTFSDDRNIRFIATNIKEAKEVSAYMEKEIDNRTQEGDSRVKNATPHYVVFNLSKTLSVRTEMLKQIFSQKANIGFSVVSFFNELKDLPKECSAVIELDGNDGKVFDRNDVTGKYTSFVPDICVSHDVTELSVKLANMHLDTLEGSFKLPSMITFLEMFGVGKVEHLNALTRWKENDPTSSLEATIGINTLNDAFKLDLHEKFHGPHGLVAGMTGSGKSEFIIAYILSMAVNYHPHEVAFILIDYKGGGMAKAFETLPHTVGIITNLDGAAVNRSLVSIQSELKRRQAIFAEASKQIGVSNIDIYKYQKLFRDGDVTEPLQHLFIISDEFAELKTQQPEFMQQLISAARIGRSLGVHLILATQKPAGVVDDQIWSNSRFRICLKVQERADSMDMLKRPDAAELSDTGRFYLQVGYNELFEIGQSAWAGAPYYPADKVLVEKDNSVTFIDLNGRPIRRIKMTPKYAKIADPQKQLDVITSYLEEIAKDENIQTRPLWLNPIDEMILVDEVREKYEIQPDGRILNPVIGEFDDPARQRQHVLELPLSKEGNVIVYGIAGSGKTTFFATTIYSLMEEHTPEEVNIYILEFAAATLRIFAEAPHVGDVILPDEEEKINNLIKMLFDEIDLRKQHVAGSGEKPPSIVIMINNFEAFMEIYGEKDDQIAFLMREGIKYDIFFMIAATGASSVRFKIQQHFKQMFVLQQNADSDYSTILGKTEGLLPSKFKGRGLVKTDALYEFQTAHVTDEEVPFDHIREICEKHKKEWKGQPAKSVPLLPERVSVKVISNYIKDKSSLNIPVGIIKSTLAPCYYDFKSAFMNLILSLGDDHLEFTDAIIKLLSEEYGIDTVVFDSPSNLKNLSNANNSYYSQIGDIESAISELANTIEDRDNICKGTASNDEKADKLTQKVIIINSVAHLKGVLSFESNENLNKILEKGELRHGITVIVAEAAKNIAGYSFEKWYKQHITQSDGIWVGSGFADQYVIKANKLTGEMREDVEEDFGFVLTRGKVSKIKLLCSEE